MSTFGALIDALGWGPVIALLYLGLLVGFLLGTWWDSHAYDRGWNDAMYFANKTDDYLTWKVTREDKP